MVRTKIKKLEELLKIRGLLSEFLTARKKQLMSHEKKKIREEIDRLNFHVNILTEMPMGMAKTEYKERSYYFESKLNRK